MKTNIENVIKKVDKLLNRFICLEDTRNEVFKVKYIIRNIEEETNSLSSFTVVIDINNHWWVLS